MVKTTITMKPHHHRVIAKIGLAIALCWPPSLTLAQTDTNTQTAPAKPVSVEATAINAHAFRLHVSFADAPAKQQSLFIDANSSSPRTAVETVKDGAFSGVRTGNGALLVDREKGLWMLKDSQGRVVIPATSLASLGSDDRTGRPQITCPMGAASGPATIYGSGDMNGGIVQQRGQSRVGNGVTGVPYYWSSAGYSVLALGEDDNAPGNWQRNETDGTITWTMPGNSLDLYLMPAARLQEGTEDYAELTGRPPVPPRWAMGYMQSRWGWRDRAYIEDTLKQFLDRKLPVDAFIFDFEWYTPQPDYSVPAAGSTNYTDFSWNPVLFPEPEKQVADLHAHGVHVVGIRKPRLGNSELLTQLRERGWISTAGRGQGALSRGGTEQRLLNYSRGDVRDWYAQQMAPLLKAGIDGWWNDEGEQTYTTYTYWNQSEALALSMVNSKQRLWTINRAFQPGMQRYGAAAWTGDIASNWRAFADTPARLLNWSLAGMFYGACDIGGFMGQDTPELLTRWMEAGVFFPVMRSHSANIGEPALPVVVWRTGGGGHPQSPRFALSAGAVLLQPGACGRRKGNADDAAAGDGLSGRSAGQQSDQPMAHGRRTHAGADPCADQPAQRLFSEGNLVHVRLQPDTDGWRERAGESGAGSDSGVCARGDDSAPGASHPAHRRPARRAAGPANLPGCQCDLHARRGRRPNDRLRDGSDAARDVCLG